MFFPQHEDTQRPIRIKRGVLPRANILLAARRRFLHQSSHRLRHSSQFSSLSHIGVDPQLSFFSFNRRHLYPSVNPIKRSRQILNHPPHSLYLDCNFIMPHHFNSSTSPTLFSAFKYSTTMPYGTGPYSAETISQIRTRLLPSFPPAKFSTS